MINKIKIFAAIIFAATIFFGCASGEEKNLPEKPAEEKIVQPVAPPQISEKNLIINTNPQKYTYENFLQDAQVIAQTYPELVTLSEICTTADGRSVIDLVVGDKDGQNQILVFGAMHAREYITAQIVMRQLCDAIDSLNGYGSDYRGIPSAELLRQVTVHFVPMSNPDGVTISQLGPSVIKNETLREKIISMSDGDFVQWKANASGVDLNRNFDAGWNEFRGSPGPSAERYKGAFPGSEPESAALINLTKNFHIKRAISYHTCGALIYWYYKQSGAVLDESQKFAEDISRETGYPLDGDYTSVDAAGYKDWAVYKLGVPSITIETGAEVGGIINPVPQNRFGAIWERNKNVVYATAQNLLYEIKR